MKNTSILAIVAAAFVSSAFAEKLTFDFKDPKGVNNIVFNLDAPLETISGSTNGLSGTLIVDPETLTDFAGKLLVAASSLQVSNPMMNEHMLGEKWLDTKKYPEISFEVKKVENVKKVGAVTTGDVTGTFALHGVSKDITVPAQVTYLPGRLKDRVPNQEGDLLVIRSTFTISRSDFDIQKGQNENKVSDEIKITLAVAGASQKK